MAFTRVYHGRARYLSDTRHGPNRLLLAVTCQIAELPVNIPAMLDTAAEWCVLPQELVAALGVHAQPEDSWVRLDSRLGRFDGFLARIPITLLADEGPDLTVNATCLICPDWPGPMVLGWKGCLERFRFALEPEDETFYFASG